MYWFILGHEPLLSAAELAAVFNLPAPQIEGSVLRAPLESFDPISAMRRLGGTVKIGQEIQTNITEKELLDAMATQAALIQGKIHFGISWYGASNADAKNLVANWGKITKRTLKEKERSVRFVYNHETTLSSVSVAKNGLTARGVEFMIMPAVVKGSTSSPRYCLAVTLAVQPFEDFSARDYGRPGRDDASGMLPPKLALMMINLASVRTDETILDPFCGSGTIISEAWLMGYQKIIGTDISNKAMTDTKTNIDWLKQKQALSGEEPSLFVADVTQLSTHLSPGSVSAVITEPYLGPPLRGRETARELQSQADTLKTLYANALGELVKILKKGGRAIFIIPRFRQGKNWITIDCVEEVEKAGFSVAPLLPHHTSLLYARANQYVGREIWKFIKK